MSRPLRKSALGSILFAGAVLLVAVTVQAQQSRKIAKIGYLIPSTPVAAVHAVEGFRQGLRELGYVEGQTFVLELRYGQTKAERFSDLARELVGLKMDVIVTASDGAIVALKRETQTIPIVMAVSSDPVGTGFVASLAHPGGNITGLSMIAPELSGKRLGLLREVVPALSRVVFLWNPDVRGGVLDYNQTESAASSLRIQLQSVEVSRSEDLDRALSTIAKERAQALIVPAPNPVGYASRDQIAAFAQKNKLPSMYGQQEYVDAGGLMSYGPSNREMHRRAATYVHKILKGTKPADLPVEQPRKFELAISLKTAKQIGLTIPPNVLARADRVIK